jgi:hypothetical protein
MTLHSILLGDHISTQAQKSVSGYIASDLTGRLAENQTKLRTELRSIVHNLNSNDSLVLSCEGWHCNVSELLRLEIFEDYLDAIHLLVLVRPYVSWINSAFWQWGAWTQSNIDEWLGVSAIPGCMWGSLISKIHEECTPPVKVIPIIKGKNCLEDVLKYLDVDDSLIPLISKVIHNTSLPAEILQLYLRYPALRPTRHSSELDFWMSSAISSETSKLLSPTPLDLK